MMQLHVGHSTVYGLEQADGTVKVLTDCAFSGGMVKFYVTKEQAAELFNPARRRQVQDIAPDLDKSLREVFITGIGPMDYEVMCGIKPDETLKRYHGTIQVECPNCGEDAVELTVIGKGKRKGYCCPKCKA